MTDNDKMQYIRYMQLVDELDNVVYGGIGLYLDGTKTDAHSIARACVFNEDAEYMRDYKRDNWGRVSELNFDQVDIDES